MVAGRSGHSAPAQTSWCPTPVPASRRCLHGECVRVCGQMHPSSGRDSSLFWMSGSSRPLRLPHAVGTHDGRRVVTEKSNGEEYACKSVCKRLDIPNLSPAKQAQHIDNVKREIEILRRLRGTLRYGTRCGLPGRWLRVGVLRIHCSPAALKPSVGVSTPSSASSPSLPAPPPSLLPPPPPGPPRPHAPTPPVATHLDLSAALYISRVRTRTTATSTS